MADDDFPQFTTFVNRPNGESGRLTERLGNSSLTNNNTEESYETKVYFKRWIILILYVLLSISSNFHWMQYTIIVDIVSRYYGASILAVQWTALTINVLNVIGLFPLLYLGNKIDLRRTCLLIAALSCTGSWIKYFAVSPNLFLLIIIAQIVVAPSMILCCQLSTMVASQWFGTNEVSTATSIACLGTIVGIGFSNLIPPIFIENHENLLEIEQNMSRFFLVIAILNIALTIAVFLWFENKPKLPPSRARLLQMRLRKNVCFIESLKRLLRDKDFLLLWVAHGLGFGYMNSILLLIPLFVSKLENHQNVLVGTYAVTRSVFGIFGMAVFGRVLDKSKKFREVIIFLYISLIIAEGILAGLIYTRSRWLYYIAWANLGFVGLSYWSTSLDVGVEITYPESESYSAALLGMSNIFFAIFIETIATKLLEHQLDLVTHVFFECILVCGLVITLITKYKYRRQFSITQACNNVTSEIQNGVKYKFLGILKLHKYEYF